MTSVGPYNQSYSMSHMRYIRDINGSLPKRVFCPSSLTSILSGHGSFSKFAEILKKSDLEYILNDSQANFTLFVPTDDALRGMNVSLIDRAIARHIVQGSMMDNVITTDILASTLAAYYPTRAPPNRLMISNIKGEIFVGNCAQIIRGNVQAGNGIIHVVNKPIIPYDV